MSGSPVKTSIAYFSWTSLFRSTLRLNADYVTLFNRAVVILQSFSCLLSALSNCTGSSTRSGFGDVSRGTASRVVLVVAIGISEFVILVTSNAFSLLAIRRDVRRGVQGLMSDSHLSSMRWRWGQRL